MAMLDHAVVEGLSPHSAQVIKGKLGWILQSAWGGVGRAAAQPLVSSTGSKSFLLPGGRQAPPETHGWTPELASMTQFFQTLFKFLPPLRQTLGAPPRCRLLVYSDAQYSQCGRKGLGVVVTDTLTNASYMCGGEVPDDILAWMDSFGSRKKQKINQCELLTVIAAVIPSAISSATASCWYGWTTCQRSSRPCMDIVTRQRWCPCLTPSTYCSRAFRPPPVSCTSLGRRTPLTFLVACPFCVEMGPMLWTQLDSNGELQVSRPGM